jgi:hypothetical protein
MKGARDEAWIFEGGLIYNKNALEKLKEWGLCTVEGADQFQQGEELRRYPEKSIVTFEDQGKRYFLKRYHYSRPWVFIRALLKFNFPVFSGPAEWQRLTELKSAGFRVPEVVAAGIGGTSFYGLSFIILEELPGQSIEALLAPQSVCSAKRQRRLAKSLGHWIRRFHEAGFCHKDLYLCHLFVNDSDVLGMLDCERVQRWPGKVPERWIIKDLAALHYSSSALLLSSSRLLFLNAYFGDAHGTRAAKALLKKVEDKVTGMARKGRKV